VTSGSPATAAPAAASGSGARPDASPDLAAGLAHAIADADPGGPPPAVTVEASASVGATRRTLFVEVTRGGVTTPAVAQLVDVGMEGVSPTVEASCIRLAADAGVPVAEPLWASDDRSYVGAAFGISRRVEGMTVPRHVLRATADDPALGTALTRQLGAALAALHQVDTDDVPDAVRRLVDPSPTEAYLHHLRAVAAAAPRSPVLALGLRWLDDHQPAPAPPALVHSDARNGNLAVDRSGLVALLDWELIHVGDPMEDLAWSCLRCWRFGEDHLEVGGFGTRADLRGAYEAAGGTWREDAFGWWKVARTTWWCLVLQLQAMAFTSGASSSLVLAASGRRAAELEYDLLCMIRPSPQ
jgi:aminoglycoside phosphotransferase (APT) family kinase protein